MTIEQTFDTLVSSIMSKVLDEPIQLLSPPPEARRAAPAGFAWRGRRHHVAQIGGHWALRGRWWLGEGYKRFFRVLTTDHLTLDLCLDELTGNWTVAEIKD